MVVKRRAGNRRHYVELQSVARTSSGEAYAETWTTYARQWAAIQPATPAQIERVVSSTTETPVTHLVETDYHSSLTAADRVLFGTRNLYIRGLQNVDEQNITHVLACEERV